jgi:hypothetical protein
MFARQATLVRCAEIIINARRNGPLGIRRQLPLRVAAFALACVGIFILCASLFRSPHEPIYDGRKLSEWLKSEQQSLQTSHLVRGYGDGEIFSPLIDAGEYTPRGWSTLEKGDHFLMRRGRIDTNAIPCLLAWMRSPPPEWPAKANHALGGFAAHLKKVPLLGSLLDTNRDWPCRLVTLGFQELGPRAAPAVPELTRMLKESRSPHVQRHALRALACIGSEGLPSIVASLDMPNCDHALAAQLIGLFPEAGRVATPGLLRALHDPDMLVRSEAYQALWTINPLALDAIGLPPPTTPDSLAKANQLLRITNTVIWFP